MLIHMRVVIFRSVTSAGPSFRGVFSRPLPPLCNSQVMFPLPSPCIFDAFFFFLYLPPLHLTGDASVTRDTFGILFSPTFFYILPTASFLFPFSPTMGSVLNFSHDVGVRFFFSFPFISKQPTESYSFHSAP